MSSFTYSSSVVCNPYEMISQLYREDKSEDIFFRNFLMDNSNDNPCPRLLCHDPSLCPDTSLVRYRGMVFDVLDLEFYCESYRLLTGTSETFLCKYRDVLQQQHEFVEIDESSIKTASRSVYLFVPIPGETEWVRRFTDNNNNNNNNSVLGKRPLDSSPPIVRHNCCVVKLYGQTDGFRLNDMVEMVGVVNYPTDSQEMEIQQQQQLDLDMDDEDICSRIRIPPLSPVIHCLSHRVLSSSYPLVDIDISGSDSGVGVQRRWGLLNSNNNNNNDNSDINSNSNNNNNTWFLGGGTKIAQIEERLFAQKDNNNNNNNDNNNSIRTRLLDLFQSRLGGDRLAAELLLLNVLSQALLPSPDSCPSISARVGMLSLNLRNCSDSLSTLLLLLLSSLLPRCVSVDASDCCCRLCEKNQRAVSACCCCSDEKYPQSLQVGAGTLVILRDNNNINNNNNNLFLQRLLTSQELAVSLRDGDHVTVVVVPVQCSFLILSASGCCFSLGDEQTDPSFVSLALEATTTTIESQDSVSEEVLMEFRLWLSLVRQLDVGMAEETRDVLEAEFVTARQQLQQQDQLVGEVDFHRWLHIARLVAISYGHNTITKTHWEHVKELERCRKIRNQV